MARPIWRWGILAIVVLCVLIQLVPYGRNHTNPPVLAEPQWDSPQTRELAVRACFDCHSNETKWPFYSHIAPMSWLVQRDVDRGRSRLNFSEWTRPQRGADDAVEVVREGVMPLKQYLILHPEARLSAAEREALASGLEATIGPGLE
jgi:hypothetical protein